MKCYEIWFVLPTQKQRKVNGLVLPGCFCFLFCPGSMRLVWLQLTGTHQLICMPSWSEVTNCTTLWWCWIQLLPLQSISWLALHEVYTPMIWACCCLNLRLSYMGGTKSTCMTHTVCKHSGYSQFLSLNLFCYASFWLSISSVWNMPATLSVKRRWNFCEFFICQCVRSF